MLFLLTSLAYIFMYHLVIFLQVLITLYLLAPVIQQTPVGTYVYVHVYS